MLPAKELKKRTLTNLYNQRPTWLDLAHKKLDEAVFADYGWSNRLPKQHPRAVAVGATAPRGYNCRFDRTALRRDARP